MRDGRGTFRSAGVATWILPALVVIGVLGVIGYVVVATGSPATGPVELVWDKTACAECRMHIGEPAFAAQLRTADHRVLAFDDPGCLFELLSDLPRAPIGIWFRHLHEPRWIGADAVAFLPIEPTPMGYGIGAVDAGTAGAMSLEAARAKVAAAGEQR